MRETLVLLLLKDQPGQDGTRTQLISALRASLQLTLLAVWVQINRDCPYGPVILGGRLWKKLTIEETQNLHARKLIVINS